MLAREGLSRPRVNHANIEILKVPHLAGGEIGVLRNDDAGDERVTNFE